MYYLQKKASQRRIMQALKSADPVVAIATAKKDFVDRLLARAAKHNNPLDEAALLKIDNAWTDKIDSMRVPRTIQDIHMRPSKTVFNWNRPYQGENETMNVTDVWQHTGAIAGTGAGATGLYYFLNQQLQ